MQDIAHGRCDVTMEPERRPELYLLQLQEGRDSDVASNDESYAGGDSYFSDNTSQFSTIIINSTYFNYIYGQPAEQSYFHTLNFS